MSIIMRPNQSWFDSQDALRVASEVLAAIGSEVSQALRVKLDSGDHESVARATIDPKDYDDVLLFSRDYQAISLVRKATFLQTSVDREKAAYDKFVQAEKRCEETNKRLRDFEDRGFTASPEHVPSESVHNAICIARNLIHRILGDVPSTSRMRFGPGATSLVTGGITLPRKYSREIHVTPELYPYWRDICGENWCKLVKNVEYSFGSKVSYVRKTALTDRTIGIEPHVNIYAQLGIGGEMRRLFKPWIDLTVGQERNRALASVAHRYGLATVDFESASDTVSRQAVWTLLPEKWCILLDRVRSHRYHANGSIEVFHKHSSMGNGYTFELESIIFYCIARACTFNGHEFWAEHVSAYGDDVILPQSCASLFIETAEYLGFKVNREKSFVSGSFFESCGHDYFHGVNVRPKFWKELNPLFGFKVHNDLREMAVSLRLPSLQRLADKLRSSAPTEFRRCLIPRGLGDVGFVVPWDCAMPSVRHASDGWCGFKTKALKFHPAHRDYSTSVSGLLAALDAGGEQSSAPVRGSGHWQVGSLVTFGDWDA